MLFHGISGGHIQGIMEEMERRSKTESRLAKGGQMNGRETVRKELALFARESLQAWTRIGTDPTLGKRKTLLPSAPSLTPLACGTLSEAPCKPTRKAGRCAGQARLCICLIPVAACALWSNGEAAFNQSRDGVSALAFCPCSAARPLCPREQGCSRGVLYFYSALLAASKLNLKPRLLTFLNCLWSEARD